ncbi:MAG: alpha/beta fold hydrolase [Blastocatellia bacterium]
MDVRFRKSLASVRELISRAAAQLSQHPFLPPAPLRNGHSMTLFSFICRRRFQLAAQSQQVRVFAPEPDVRVLARCHWQPQRHRKPTVILLHGLEASSEARYILGTADKAWQAGFNVVRLNMRGCGGSERLSPSLYHCGLTSDLWFIIRELIEADGLPELYLIGFSMGGNQALKFAGELGDEVPSQLRGVCAVSPPIDLQLCSEALLRRENFLYERYYLNCLRSKLRRTHHFFPELIELERLNKVRSMADFDDFAMPLIGFSNVTEYYEQASALSYLSYLQIPALIIHAQDDPFIPFAPFTNDAVRSNPLVLLLAPEYGGHVGFYGQRQPDEDRFWAENRAVDFCSLLSAEAAVTELRPDLQRASATAVRRLLPAAQS